MRHHILQTPFPWLFRIVLLGSPFTLDGRNKLIHHPLDPYLIQKDGIVLSACTKSAQCSGPNNHIDRNDTPTKVITGPRSGPFSHAEIQSWLLCLNHPGL